jgi:hypothetical protein
MTTEEFEDRLRRGGTVPLSAREWEELAPDFPVVERHQTQLAGDLLIVRFRNGLCAVEAPSRDARVARVFGGHQEARAFVEKRMKEYERMWDGCGVKVDYYGTDQ